MEQKALFLCNTVYQIMVTLWIKHHYLKNKHTDIIISDHMNNSTKIVEKIKEEKLFNKVFYAETLDEARYKIKRSRKEILKGNIFPMKQLEEYVCLTYSYSDLYLANFDGFSQMLFNAMNYNNSSLKLHIFEDGLSTYFDFEKYYKSFKCYYYNPESEEKNFIKKFVHQKIYQKRTLYGNIYRILVFNPEIMKWNPDCEIFAMDKIDKNDKEYCELVNRIFDVEKSKDTYDRKYLFFEESFFADGEVINDVELIEMLAGKVGKENIMIKIHPRNPVNRFADLGYKTNRDTSIPWEVLLMNMENVSDKILITVASSAILNPIMIFGTAVKAYSLYPCLSIIPHRLRGETWEFLESLFKQYPDMITICEDINFIE